MQEVPKATRLHQGCHHVSMYVVPLASSQFILVDVNMLMAGPTKRPGGISS